MQLGLSKTSKVIDFGSGSGTFALAVAPHCHSVMAIDPSPVMNAYLARRVAQTGLSNIAIVHSGFLTYVHHGAPVDFIFTRNALHHLPDFWKGLALSRLHRILAPQGIIHIKDLVYDFDPAEAQDRLDAWMSGAVDDPAAGWTAEELAEHVRKEHSTYSWIFELLLQRTGFEIMARDYVRGVYGTYTCRAI